MGRDVLEQAEKGVAAPMFIVSVKAIAPSAIGTSSFIWGWLEASAKSWYHCFERFLNIPHNMMTLAEGNDYQNLLITIAKAYVESNQPGLKLKIGYRMAG